MLRASVGRVNAFRNLFPGLGFVLQDQSPLPGGVFACRLLAVTAEPQNQKMVGEERTERGWKMGEHPPAWPLLQKTQI